MSRDACNVDEPVLRPVSGLEHSAACHFSEELMTVEAATQVFEVTATDDVDVLGDEIA
jgi:peptide/nickel transport system ATP-binding protein